MKKAVVVLVLIFVVLISNGQTGPVFQYSNPDKETIHSLAVSENAKGYAFRTYLIGIINIGLKDTTLKVSLANINYVFNNLFFEEFYLKEGEYSNSGYNPTLKKMIPGKGHEWTGFGWVFRVGTFSLRLLKGDCANILKTPVIREIIKQPVAKEEKAFYPPVDLGVKPFETPKETPPVWRYEPPEIQKKKFFQKKGVKIGCFVIGTGGIGGILYAIFHKGHSAPHGTMSGGRPYTTTPSTTTITPGDGSGGRGN